MRKNMKLVMVERDKVSNLSLCKKSAIGNSIGYPLSDPYFVSNSDIIDGDHIYIPRSGRILKCDRVKDGKVKIITGAGERYMDAKNCMKLEATYESIRWVKTKSRKSILSSIASGPFSLKKMDISDLKRILDNGGDCIIDQSIESRHTGKHLIFEI